MKSIGVSVLSREYNTDSISSIFPIQLHLNLWKSMYTRRPWYCLSARRNNERADFFLDIGIMASFSIMQFKIFLPFTLNQNSQWSDLRKDIITNNSDPMILCALFNEDYKITGDISSFTRIELANPRQLKANNVKEAKTNECCFCSLLKSVKSLLGKNIESSKSLNKLNTDTPDDFYFYSLDEKDVSSERYLFGTLFTISIPERPKGNNNEYFYIRFRIPISNSNGLAYSAEMSNDWLQSAFTELDMYNILINELRDIPDDVKPDLLKENFKLALFSKIHILYITTPQVKVENGSRVKSDSRLIESESWKPYIPTDKISDAYLAHHWKFANDNKLALHKMNLFFTAEFPKIHWKKVIPYIGIVIILGTAGSILASFLCGGDPPVVRNVFIAVLISALFYYFWYFMIHWWIPFITI